MHKKPSISRLIIVNLATWLLSRVQNSKPQSGASLGRSAVRVFFDLSGFVLLTIAGFTLSSLAGFIVAGISCFILARHLTSTEANVKPDPMMR